MATPFKSPFFEAQATSPGLILSNAAKASIEILTDFCAIGSILYSVSVGGSVATPVLYYGGSTTGVVSWELRAIRPLRPDLELLWHCSASTLEAKNYCDLKCHCFVFLSCNFLLIMSLTASSK